MNTLAKKTVKNQITLPKAVVARFPGVEHFEVSAEEGCIILRPLEHSRAGEVRAKLEKLGIDESDISAAMNWARKGR